MTLYHFTAKHLSENIKNTGLTLGAIPVMMFNRMVIIRGYIWLTDNPNRHEQYWDTMKVIPYSRTDVRLTVNIPNENKLKTMDDIKKLFTLPEGFFNCCYGAWYVYKGKILPKYIVEYKELR